VPLRSVLRIPGQTLALLPGAVSRRKSPPVSPYCSHSLANLQMTGIHGLLSLTPYHLRAQRAQGTQLQLS
jgi:hypothetical protein